LDEVAAAPDLRAVVLRGEGEHFVSGTDISQFTAFTSGDDGVAYEKLLDAIVAKLETVRIPTVAVIQGYCVGGGLALAAACDLRICTPDARFGVPIAKTVGNCLSVANLARLVSRLGESATKAMLYTATFLTAQDARARDFIMEVVPAELLEERIRTLCALLASHAPITLQVTKEGIRRVLSAGSVDGADLVRRAYGSSDFREGLWRSVLRSGKANKHAYASPLSQSWTLRSPRVYSLR
jgi:enoyl-CoA hydratase/carnithine racemase